MPQVQVKSQQGNQKKKQSKLIEQIVTSVWFGVLLASGLLFIAEIVSGILGSLISALWWILVLVSSAVFVGVSHVGMSKKVRKLSKVIVLIAFLLVFPLFTANLMVTYQNAAENLSTPTETEYFRSVLGRSYNYTELYQWENSVLQWNNSANMIVYTDPIQIYQYGQARCEGYAILYAELCISQGYEARIVVNIFGDHAWNELKLNGAWTRVDASPTGASMNENIGFPLFYETKWNAAPVLALAFENSSIVDVTSNYRSDRWSLFSGMTMVLFLVGAWLAVCIFIIRKSQWSLRARSSVSPNSIEVQKGLGSTSPMGTKLFLISYFGIIVFASLLSILLSFGMFSEVLQIILYVSVLGTITIILTFLRMKIIKHGTTAIRAPSSELQREDDVLLQSIVMSQSLLLFFLNITLQNIIAKIFLSTLVAVLFVSFYLIRAYAKIKGSPKCRYYSAYLLGIILTNTTAISAFVLSNQPLSFFLSRPLIPDLLVTFFLPFYAWDIFYDFTKKVLKKRYGYS